MYVWDVGEAEWELVVETEIGLTLTTRGSHSYTPKLGLFTWNMRQSSGVGLTESNQLFTRITITRRAAC